MELFKLFGTIAIDNAEANHSLDETGDKAEETSKDIKKVGDEGEESEGKLGKAFSKMGDAAAKVGKAIAAGLAVASAAVIKIGKDAISAYGDYEQLVGGVETLFKDSSDTVIQNAANAYKTAGMSANEYMETVTSFSASLLQSLGGDTVAAAKKADVAITDMSDNANKMGTSMEAIQNAYQGFAKQNYTMLDNLKLGYGGTKEEMERLLADASKISGIKYDVSSYSDIVDAIHVVQNEMGITGTTAKEASATIQGSLSSAKSAWTNLITGLADGTQDFGGLVENFFESVVNVADNIVPRISQVLETLPSLITKLVPKLISKASEVFSKLLPAVIKGATSLLNAVVSVIPQLLDALIAALPELISGIEQVFYAIVDALPGLMKVICDALPELIPQLITALVNMIVYLCNNLMTIIQPLLDNLPAIIISIVDALMDNLPTLIQGLITLVLAIVEALPEIIMALIEAIPTIIASILEGLWNALPVLLEGLGQIMIKLLEPIWNALSPFFEDLMNFFSSIWDGIVSVFSAVGSWVYDNIIAPVANFFQGLWEGIVSAFHTVIDPWIEIVKRAAALVHDEIIVPIKNFFKGLWEDIVGIFSVVKDWFNQHIAEPVKNIFTNIWNAIKNGASKAWEGIKSVFSPVTDWFKNIFSKAWTAVKNVFSTGGKIFDGIKDGIVNAFKTVVNAIIRGINKVITIPFNAINSVLSKIHGISILGVSPFSWVHTFNVPQIPELAEGGVLEKGQVGLLEGEGAEAVVPLEKNTGWIRNVARQIHEFTLETNANIAGMIPDNYGKSLEYQEQQITAIDILAEKFEKVLMILAEYFPEFATLLQNRQVVLADAGGLAHSLAPAMNKELGIIYTQKGRGNE